jgi:hypothetical protein
LHGRKFHLGKPGDIFPERASLSVADGGSREKLIVVHQIALPKAQLNKALSDPELK